MPACCCRSFWSAILGYATTCAARKWKRSATARPPSTMRASAPNAATMLPGRSEEHTSELQSLMRISYAVFCLKQTKHSHIYLTTIHRTHTTQNIPTIHHDYQ